MLSVKIGQAQVSIVTKGCVRCGTEYAPGWQPAQVVPVTIGSRRLEVGLSICAPCVEAEAPLLAAAEKKGGR